MKASIIIPAYNAENTVGRAVSSALNQDFKDKFEVIVVNDGSADNTLKILKSFGKKIRLINQKNKGAVVAANVGFKKAKGEYVVKLDADDEFFPGLLSDMARILCCDLSVDFVYSDYYEHIGSRIKYVSTENLFATVAGGVMFRRKKFKQEGFYREDVGFCEYDLLLRTLGHWKGYRIAKPLFIYHRRAGSISSDSRWVEKELNNLRKLYPHLLSEIKKIRGYAI